ncbi:RING-H2 finger protein [Lentzea sp. E54]|uniref:RING-H2 finger protein n=1 Tax=Lentzea xerophila TaxID=3435883 RepID=UPI003DA2EB43
MPFQMDLAEWPVIYTAASLRSERQALVDATAAYNAVVGERGVSVGEAQRLLDEVARHNQVLHENSDVLGRCFDGFAVALGEWCDELRAKAERVGHFAVVLDCDVSVENMLLSFDVVFGRWGLPVLAGSQRVAEALTAQGRTAAAADLEALHVLRQLPGDWPTDVGLAEAADQEQVREALAAVVAQTRVWAAEADRLSTSVLAEVVGLRDDATELRDCAVALHTALVRPAGELARIAESACAICCESLSEGMVRRLACAHHYHDTCVQAWLSVSGTCPQCRAGQPVDSAALGMSSVDDHAPDFEEVPARYGADGPYVREHFPPEQRQTLYVAWPDTPAGRESAAEVRCSVGRYGAARANGRAAAAEEVRRAVKRRDELLGVVATQDLTSWGETLDAVIGTVQDWWTAVVAGDVMALGEVDRQRAGLERRLEQVRIGLRLVSELDDELAYVVPKLSILLAAVGEMADALASAAAPPDGGQVALTVAHLRQISLAAKAELAPLIRYSALLQDDHAAVMAHVGEA